MGSSSSGGWRRTGKAARLRVGQRLDLRPVQERIKRRKRCKHRQPTEEYGSMSAWLVIIVLLVIIGGSYYFVRRGRLNR